MVGIDSKGRKHFKNIEKYQQVPVGPTCYEKMKRGE